MFEKATDIIRVCNCKRHDYADCFTSILFPWIFFLFFFFSLFTEGVIRTPVYQTVLLHGFGFVSFLFCFALLFIKKKVNETFKTELSSFH